MARLDNFFSDHPHFCNAYLIGHKDQISLGWILGMVHSEHLKSGIGNFTASNFSFPSFKSKHYLGGGFKYFLCLPLFGEDSHFD